MTAQERMLERATLQSSLKIKCLFPTAILLIGLAFPCISSAPEQISEDRLIAKIKAIATAIGGGNSSTKDILHILDGKVSGPNRNRWLEVSGQGYTAVFQPDSEKELAATSRVEFYVADRGINLKLNSLQQVFGRWTEMLPGLREETNSVQFKFRPPGTSAVVLIIAETYAKPNGTRSVPIHKVIVTM